MPEPSLRKNGGVAKDRSPIMDNTNPGSVHGESRRELPKPRVPPQSAIYRGDSAKQDRTSEPRERRMRKYHPECSRAGAPRYGEHNNKRAGYKGS